MTIDHEVLIKEKKKNAFRPQSKVDCIHVPNVSVSTFYIRPRKQYTIIIIPNILL